MKLEDYDYARVLEQTERFHSLPEERKMEVKVLAHNIGYLPLFDVATLQQQTDTLCGAVTFVPPALSVLDLIERQTQRIPHQPAVEVSFLF